MDVDRDKSENCSFHHDLYIMSILYAHNILKKQITHLQDEQLGTACLLRKNSCSIYTPADYLRPHYLIVLSPAALPGRLINFFLYRMYGYITLLPYIGTSSNLERHQIYHYTPEIPNKNGIASSQTLFGCAVRGSLLEDRFDTRPNLQLYHCHSLATNTILFAISYP